MTVLRHKFSFWVVARNVKGETVFPNTGPMGVKNQSLPDFVQNGLKMFLYSKNELKIYIVCY